MPTISPKFSINVDDFLKSLLVASLSQPILVILTSITAGHFNINWTEQWHLAASSGAAYLIKNYFSGPNPPTAGGNPTGFVGKSAIFMMLLLFYGLFTYGQSIFKPYPKPAFKANRFAHTIAVMDSSVTAVRPVAIAAAYGYESGGVSFLMAGSGIGLKHLHWDEGSGKWSSQYSFNAVAWAQGQVAPSGSINPFSFAFGPTIGFLNDVIQVGFAWDFTKGKPMAIMVFSIPTNN